jgi:glycosyltransferase involved in cell wall biosynthesis
MYSPGRRGRGTVKPIVLHVSEAFGGGIISAITQFADLTLDQYDHALAVRVRHGHSTGDDIGQCFLSVVYSENSLLNFIWLVRSVERELKPDIIHLHSTIAGILGRVFLPGPQRILYSPHCFADERRDLSAPVRQQLRFLEHLLSGRCAQIAAIGDYEAQKASKLLFRPKVVRVPNSVRNLPTRFNLVARRRRSRLTIATIGRISPQKDWRFFLSVVRHCAAKDVDFLWIGGGSALDEADLRRAGVTVTGWLSRSQVLFELKHSVDLYLHTALWEGTPITLLEAAALDVPIIARDIPHIRDVPLSSKFNTPDEAAGLIEAALSPAARRKIAADNTRVLDAFSWRRTRDALVAAYSSVQEDASAARTRLLLPAE